VKKKWQHFPKENDFSEQQPPSNTTSSISNNNKLYAKISSVKKSPKHGEGDAPLH
jgi:hypothetical protein